MRNFVPTAEITPRPLLATAVNDRNIPVLCLPRLAFAANQSGEGVVGQLAVDCLAGSWTYDMLHRSRRTKAVTLSPGDLDEAVAALLAFGRAEEGSGPTAFDRIAAYRSGVLQGLDAC